MKTKGYQPSEPDRELTNIFKSEKTEWEEGQVWITDKVAFWMKNIIKKARKNYLSIYDNDTDPTTGRKKVFVPFTEWTVDNVYKNIDIDLSDIKVVSRKPDSYNVAQLFKYILNCYLDKANFSYTLNEMLKNGVCVDGTGFLKVWREGKKLYVKFIDRLNILIDPTAETIDDSPSIIERNILTLPEFQSYSDEWENVDYVKGNKTVDRVTLSDKMNINDSTVPFVEVYERYGYVPLFCFTGKEKDRDKYVYSLAVLSGLDTDPIVHKLKKVKSHPYGAFKLKTIKNRFDGRGVPEVVFNIQAYLNEIINIRLNTARISQTQLWKLRGSITPQQITKLFQTGAIKLDASSDIELLNSGQIDPSSYSDEDRGYDWGQRVTQTVREDEITSSMPATNALIQERGASKGYTQIKEGICISLSKFLEEKVTPLIQEIIKMESIIKFTGDPNDLETMDDKLAKNYIYRQMEQHKQQYGIYPVLTEEELEAKIEETKSQLRQMGSTRYLQMDEEYNKIFDTDYDIAIEIDEERINNSVKANQLVQLMGIIGQAGYPIDAPLAELLDTMGLDSARIVQKMIEDRKRVQKEQARMQQEQQQMQIEVGTQGQEVMPEQPTAQEPTPNPIV